MLQSSSDFETKPFSLFSLTSSNSKWWSLSANWTIFNCVCIITGRTTNWACVATQISAHNAAIGSFQHMTAINAFGLLIVLAEIACVLFFVHFNIFCVVHFSPPIHSTAICFTWTFFPLVSCTCISSPLVCWWSIFVWYN